MKKLILPFLWLTMAATSFAGAPTARDFSAEFGPYTRATYKSPVILDEKVYNPFRLKDEVGLGGYNSSSSRDGMDLTQSDIALAVGKRGVQGVFFNSANTGTRIIIGDEIFVPNEIISFLDREENVPLIPNAVVVLKAIDPSAIILDVSEQGKPSFSVQVSLRDFYLR